VFTGALDGRAQLYGTLATALEAGLSAASALGLHAERRDRWGAWARAAQLAVEGGRPFTEALDATGELPPLERAALAAGERAGKLPGVLHRLTGHLERRVSLRRELVSKLVYPAFLIHAAVLLPPLAQLITEGPGAYVLSVLPGLGALYGLVGALWVGGALARRSAGGRAATDRAAMALPFIGGAVRRRAAAEYAYVLGLLYDAGLPIIEALERAAACATNGVLAAAGDRIHRRVTDGSDLAGAFTLESEVLPRLLIEAVRTGEATGKLDETLDRTARLLREEGQRRNEALLKLLPVVVYLLVAGYIGYTVVTFYLGRLSGIS
jgi:type II secretory pathway component PulF